ncbi:MAG: iron-containing alcohol dehydrogenase [bacterium]|nr:iron-containing alcohol dehydrogenase [Acidimicrobiia bacterium]MCY4649799.1 iron-containing alcohol dehydrogenase [bacterium]
MVPRTYDILPIDRVVFGAGSVGSVNDELDRLGSRWLFLTAPSLTEKSNLVQLVADLVGARRVGTYCRSSQHVPRRNVLEATEMARRLQVDGIVALGGSSFADLAKAVAMCLAEDITDADGLERMRIEFRYPDTVRMPQMKGAPPPIVTLPTTLSAGEYTHGFGITHQRVKHIYLQRPVTPKVVVLDPELTVDTPQWLWASTGIRAIDHCVESLYSISAQPVTDALCWDGLRRLVHNLPLTVSDPGNIEARLQCQVGAWESFFGIVNVMSGLSHGLGHQLGAWCEVPHGMTSCVLLPQVMRFNLEDSVGPQALIGEILGAQGDEQSKAESAADLLQGFIAALDLPTRIRELGVDRGDLESVAVSAMKDMVVGNNPRPVRSLSEITAILEAAY